VQNFSGTFGLRGDIDGKYSKKDSPRGHVPTARRCLKKERVRVRGRAKKVWCRLLVGELLGRSLGFSRGGLQG